MPGIKTLQSGAGFENAHLLPSGVYSTNEANVYFLSKQPSYHDVTVIIILSYH